MKLGEEAIEQIKVVDWVRDKTRLLVYHIAGERKCSPQYGALLKRMGVQPGFSDLFFPIGNLKLSGLFIEMKSKKGKPTANQLQFLKDMREIGYQAECCYGADEAITMIKEFYDLK